jgi:hypothetical protein
MSRACRSKEPKRTYLERNILEPGRYPDACVSCQDTMSATRTAIRCDETGAKSVAWKIAYIKLDVASVDSPYRRGC